MIQHPPISIDLKGALVPPKWTTIEALIRESLGLSNPNDNALIVQIKSTADDTYSEILFHWDNDTKKDHPSTWTNEVTVFLTIEPAPPMFKE